MSKRKKCKGLKVSKTPIARLPKQMRDDLRKAMLLFIRDTHAGLCNVNPDIKQMGLEASLECLEELHEQGYMVFERDKNNIRYGYRVMLYDDDTGVYEDMSSMCKYLDNDIEEEEYDY